MKRNNFKSTLTLTMVSFLLVAFLPGETFAQRQSRKVKKANAKVSKTKATNVRQPRSTPVKHYKQQPRRGAHVTVLPREGTAINYRSINYHYDRGIFYRPVNGNYVISAPPIGIRVQVLPPNPFRFNLSGRNYHYYYGSYYATIPGGGYEIIQPPLGARVDALPDGYEIFELDGEVYYVLDETYYKAFAESNGNVLYEVVRV